MKLLTEVSLPEYPFSLNHRSQVLMTGSCFTENIGRLLDRYLFPVCVNPFGVTYNPLSVQRQLEALLQKDAYKAVDLDRHNELWISFDHDTSFSSIDRDTSLAKINQSFQEAKERLKQARILILTWGTSWVYRYRASGEVVCNCHKIPDREFARSRLTPREIITAYESLLPELFAFNKHLKILHTVSPVRHWKDGAHGNQLSKAALLLAGDALQQKFPEQFFYFPSYEIVMDELRDYRFYAGDMLHMGEQASQYIWERFRGILIESGSVEIIKEVEALRKMLEHRPLNEEGDVEQRRRAVMEEKLETARRKYPGLTWDKLY